MKTFNCPNCGAQISLDDSRDFGFCQYCGTKIMLDDYRSTHRVVDEARIKETETDRIIRLKELEIEEKERERNRKSRKIAYIVAVVFVVIGIIFCMSDADGFIGLLLIEAGGLIALLAFTSVFGKEKEK